MTAGRSLVELAALLRAIAAAGDDPEKLDALLDVVAGLGTIFDGAVLFKGGPGGDSFVVAAQRGSSTGGVRSWMRWPLRRLFSRMKPARILDPTRPQRAALAIPFSHVNDRSVLVAPLVEADAMPGNDEFFAALESLTIPRDSPASPLQPVLLSAGPSVTSFGVSAKIHDRISSALARRGWSVERAGSFGELCVRLQHAVPDIIAVDLTELDDPVSAITSIHRVADYAPLCVLAFYADPPRGPFASLVDRWLPHDASDAAIFLTIKQLGREAAALQRHVLREERVSAQRDALSASSANELTRIAAERAAEILGGWGACFLLNDSGTVYRAEHPQGPHALLRSIPKAFLSGTRTFHTIFDERFLDELTDDPKERDALSSLRPLSAACLALVSHDGFHRGVLAGCAFDRRADTQAFDALDDLARVVVDRFDRLRDGVGSIPELRRERFWDRLRDRAIELHVYRSADCAIPWRYREITQTRGLLTFNVDEKEASIARLSDPSFRRPLVEAFCDRSASRPFFAATIDAGTHAMDYATLGFSAPILLGRAAPAATIEQAGGMTTGVARLDSSSNAIVCDGRLWTWLSARLASVDDLSRLLDRERPGGLASIISLS